MNKNKRIKQVSRDPNKEQEFRQLSSRLAELGFVVRREKLKQGYGWKVVSGACSALGQNLVFVDQRMTQDDQIAFLKAKIADVAPVDIPSMSGASAP